ncbi:hypothetical protein [Gracilinema caldarium]|uniref:hypothetical protein n=1 Tax=Gracilinema caldarium TaxID=215591 RepID=UPI0026ED35BF|nr:hypothetical protein [Gracilinema caldarium]
MKRILIIVAAGLIAAGSLAAQAVGPGFGPGAAAVQTQNLQTVKVDGKLALVNGMIAVQSGGKTYYVGGLNRLIGFIDGLKEGASVKLEGYAIALPGAPEYQHLRVTKLTFNGKDYDLSNSFGRGMGMMGPAGNVGPNGNFGGRGGRGGRW